MSSVFVLSKHYDYEQGEVIGVFPSYEAAENHVQPDCWDLGE